jgi:predicted Zn finger-like uncharacterized protein
MTEAKQTKCPHCGSTFRISDAQLMAKGGSVRCGSCLQVFRADQHLVGALPPASSMPPPAKPKTKGKGDESWALDLIGEQGNAGSPVEAGDDEFGFSDAEVDEFIGRDTDVAISPTKSQGLRFDDELNDLLDEAGEGLPLGNGDQTDRISESADESWAKDMLSELANEEKQSKSSYSMELVDDKGKNIPKNPKLAAALGHNSDAEEDIFAALGNGVAKKAPPPSATSKPADDFLSEDADVLGFLDNDDLGGSTTPYAATNVTASNPFSLDRPLAHVDAPVVIKPRREPINWGHLLTWTFLCLITVVMFAAQYVYFNFDALAISPKTRPVMEKACAQIQNCRLPDIPDPSRLKVKELVVRKHHKAADAFQVDAILKNEAPFAQPFPILLLRFTNTQDEVVASRALRPGEYLAGEAAFMRRMPPETPVRISVSIADPGQDAVSYSLTPLH